MTKIDLKDVNLTVAVHMDFRKYLQFQWDNTLYQYTTMPFELSIAPFVFTKIMKRPVAILRGWGIRLLVYLDHMLIIAHEPKTTLHTQLIIKILSQMGFIINQEKSILTPKQVIKKFIGFMVDTTNMTYRLPPSTLTTIKTKCKTLIRNPICTARQIAALLGLMTFQKQPSIQHRYSADHFNSNPYEPSTLPGAVTIRQSRLEHRPRST